MTPERMQKALADHLRPYLKYLNRSELTVHFAIMIKGLTSNLERKSIEPICLAFSSPRELRSLQHFMSKSAWDNDGMLDEYQRQVMAALSDKDSMLTGDGCDFPKQGQMSAGVARQHCGTLGKVDSCQAGVMLGIVGGDGYGLLDARLYMPEKWLGADFADKRRKCGVPEDLEFKTKNRILSEMIAEAVGSGRFKGRYVGVDSAFGRDGAFLDSLPAGLVYFADVPSSQMVFVGRPETRLPEYAGRGRKPKAEIPSFPPVKVADIAADERIPWREAALGNGANGPILTRDKCLRVVESRDGLPGKEVWLYIREKEDNSLKYSLCNDSPEASLETIRGLATRRWSIEQCFKECKDYLGMDHYELRGWQGWKRHMLLVFISHLFVCKLRRMYAVHVNEPGPCPYIEAPVPLSDYAKAAVKFQNKEKMEHPNLTTRPMKAQQIMTIGPILDLIAFMLIKTGSLMLALDKKLRESAEAYKCKAAKKMESAVVRVLGDQPEEGQPEEAK
jgi:SRSO17 transposase